MQIPPLPKNEQERLQLLHSLNILDSPPDERLDRVTRLAARLFQVPYAFISLVDSNRQWFKSAEGLNIHETSRDVSICGHTIAAGKPLVIDDLQQDPRFADNPLVTEGNQLRFYAGAPLRFREHYVLGTLCIADSKPRSLSAEELSLLEDLAALVEGEFTALELATVDTLTNLSNRRGFQTVTNHVLKLSNRTETENCLVYIDLDSFKAINEQYGHSQGDQILVEFAELLRRSFRDVDIAARLGGDEFAVFLCDSDLEQTEVAVNRLQQAVDEFNGNTDNRFHLSMSVGVAKHDPVHHMFIDDLIAEANNNMYANKRRKQQSTTVQ